MSSLDFLSLIRAFPERMKPLLTGGANVPTAKELMGILKLKEHMNEEEEDATTRLQAYILGLDVLGKY